MLTIRLEGYTNNYRRWQKGTQSSSLYKKVFIIIVTNTNIRIRKKTSFPTNDYSYVHAHKIVPSSVNARNISYKHNSFFTITISGDTGVAVLPSYGVQISASQRKAVNHD